MAYEFLTNPSALPNSSFLTISLAGQEVRKLNGLAEEHSMLCGPKGSEQRFQLQCGIGGRRTELFELPGRAGRLCLSCSADQTISEQLAIEIDAATLSGQETENLVAEFVQLSQGLLDRAQST